ncbi:nitroreductase family deazaflavin-dependent oxidoreductase [Streptomyces sp. NPDC059215]|uniref:nitroreductase family deazaflavin-dependent oxidoreductase n=1 Tax=Streptomyces sp. NPDC059215 TaxID=3346772 RepID=UPI0036906BC5
MTQHKYQDEAIVAEFRANHGKLGGSFLGADVLLLHTIGAKSGLSFVTPLVCLPEGSRYFVFATNYGGPKNPSWYHNLLAHPEVHIEVGDDRIAVHAEELHDAEREAVYGRQAERYPVFTSYEEGTDRRIPVFALNPR